MGSKGRVCALPILGVPPAKEIAILRLRSLTTVVAFGFILRFVVCGGSSSGGSPLDGGSRTRAAYTSDAPGARPPPYCDPVNPVCRARLAKPDCGPRLIC